MLTKRSVSLNQFSLLIKLVRYLFKLTHIKINKTRSALDELPLAERI